MLHFTLWTFNTFFAVGQECYTDGKYQCTFVPIINKNTDPIIWKSREFSSCSGFFSRQKRFVERLNKFKV